MAAVIGPNAAKRELVPSGTWGNTITVHASITLAALAKDTTAAICKIPGNSVLLEFRHSSADLGTSVDGAFILEEVDDDTATTTLITEADMATAATVGAYTGAAVDVDNDSYIAISNDATTNAMTGLIDIVVQYRYLGGE